MNKNDCFSAGRKQLHTITIVLAAALALISCQSTRHGASTKPQHPLYGTWIRTSALNERGQELPIAEQYYKVIRNDQALLLSILPSSHDISNAVINGRTMQFKYVCDTLIRENGADTKIHRIDDDHFTLVWYQRMLSPEKKVMLKEITEYWERHKSPVLLQDFLRTASPRKR